MLDHHSVLDVLLGHTPYQAKLIHLWPAVLVRLDFSLIFLVCQAVNLVLRENILLQWAAHCVLVVLGENIPARTGECLQLFVALVLQGHTYMTLSTAILVAQRVRLDYFFTGSALKCPNIPWTGIQPMQHVFSAVEIWYLFIQMKRINLLNQLSPLSLQIYG